MSNKSFISEVTVVAPVPIPSGTIGNFGEVRPDEIHPGVDLAVPVGTPVKAPMEGIIKIADFNHNRKCGATIDIDHQNGFYTRFCHMSKINVNQGDKVTQGQVVGLSGGKVGAPGSGNSRGPHLHFTLKKDNQNVDPLKFINKTVSDTDVQDVDDVRRIASELGIDTENLNFSDFVKTLKPGQIGDLLQKNLLAPFMEEVQRIKQLIK